MISRHHQKKPDSQEGFTLPEMLVTVGVVGLLAAVSIPSYQKYTARARQAEAKASLSAIYTAERNYSVDARTYTNCLKQIGVTSAGQHYYGCGTAPYNPTAANCGSGANQPCNTYLYDQGVAVAACGAPADYVPISEDSTVSSSTAAVTSAAYGELNAHLPTGPFASITGVTNIAFVAACAGSVGSTGYDDWAIDNNQNMGNTHSGI